MILPITTQAVQKGFDFGRNCRVQTGHGQKTCGVGVLGQLVEVAGDAFELGHAVQMFGPQPLAHSPSFDELADHFGGPLPRIPHERFEPGMMPAIEPRTDDELLPDGFARQGAAAPVEVLFHGNDI